MSITEKATLRVEGNKLVVEVPSLGVVDRIPMPPAREDLLTARVWRLASVAEASRTLLSALPKCCRCNEARAVVEPYDAPGDYCAACAVLAGVDDRSVPLPHAAPAEALERLLHEALAAALAGEP